MNHLGDRLTSLNAPKDLKNQLIAKTHQLHFNGCWHHDLNPNNILIKDGIANIIDFGWATNTKEVPKTFPTILGGEFKGDNGYDDFESIDKIMGWVNKSEK